MSMPTMSIEYDYDKREIRIPVRVYKESSEDKDFKVLTPPVAIPSGTWELLWMLDTESCGFARFDWPGVKKCFDDVPNLVLEPLTGSLGVNYNFRVRASNTIKKEAKGNVCQVTLNFLENGTDDEFGHDPTIAVTLDPVGGGHRRPHRKPTCDPV